MAKNEAYDKNRMNAAVDAINDAADAQGRLAARDIAVQEYDKATRDQKDDLWRGRRK